MKPCERNTKGSIWAMNTDNDKNQTSIENSSPLCHLQNNFRLVNLKLDHRIGGKWFIQGPKHRKKNYLLCQSYTFPECSLWWLSVLSFSSNVPYWSIFVKISNVEENSTRFNTYFYSAVLILWYLLLKIWELANQGWVYLINWQHLDKKGCEVLATIRPRVYRSMKVMTTANLIKKIN